MTALQGLLVVALEQAVAAPFCTSRLADVGARVIKIEREGGDFARSHDRVVKGESAYFVWLNRGKESVVLDLVRPDDAALLRRMIARADIFIENLAPGAATRLGFDPVALRQAHPRLITCPIAGYGPDGPYRTRKAYDLLIQAEAGLASITGTAEAPGRVGISVAAIAAAFARYDGPSLRRALDTAGIAFGDVNDVAALAAHPHLACLSVETPVGPIALPRPPAQIGEPLEGGAVPALDQHDASVRAEFAAPC
jgi:crotonobetainyl-CoA:carnitine CoA-transferase CaiB-like acyl-CoA transferase